jgi:alanyl-tRNA synthetase
MGVGPCGPNTEIFYDRGSSRDPKKQGIKLLQQNLENDRYLEI